MREFSITVFESSDQIGYVPESLRLPKPGEVVQWNHGLQPGTTRTRPTFNFEELIAEHVDRSSAGFDPIILTSNIVIIFSFIAGNSCSRGRVVGRPGVNFRAGARHQKGFQTDGRGM